MNDDYYDKRDAEKAAALSNLINDYGFNAREVAKRMAREHPTLEQNLMRFCAAFIEEMAAKSMFDARNEASVMFARRVIAATPDRDQRYFPII